MDLKCHTCKHCVYGTCDDGLLTILKIGYSLTSVINMSVSRAHGLQLITGSGTFLGGIQLTFAYGKFRVTAERLFE